MRILTLIICITTLLSCTMKETPTIANVERLDPALDAIVDNDVSFEIIAEGYEWSEGPVWLESTKTLLFSDVPKNTIYKWSEGKKAEVYLTPSGYTGAAPRTGETGSNGLTLDAAGNLVLAQHGDRRIARMNAPLDAPKADFTSIADNYQGKKFNSPNDVVFRSNGDAFFTDPAYGLPQQFEDPTRELMFCGVYKASHDSVTLITDSLTRPNGVAFFPGEKTLLVSNSDADRAIWYAFDLGENDSITNARIFYDATALTKTEQGLPDGMKFDKQGNLFATGPGGVWIFNSHGKVLGKIKTKQIAANCALSGDEKTLFITADPWIIKVKLRK